jgi:hypothetical protein
MPGSLHAMGVPSVGFADADMIPYNVLAAQFVA